MLWDFLKFWWHFVILFPLCKRFIRGLNDFSSSLQAWPWGLHAVQMRLSDSQAVCKLCTVAAARLACHTSINLVTKDTMSPNRLRQFIIVSRAHSLNFMLVQFPWLTRSQGLMAYHRPTVHILGLCHRKSPRFLALLLFPWDVSKSSSGLKGRGFYLRSWNITGEWAIFYSVLECTILFVQINLSKLAVNMGKWRNTRDLWKKKKKGLPTRMKSIWNKKFKTVQTGSM